MKKVLILMMCCLGLAFASCKPDQVPANQAFIGNYMGTMYLNGTATIPELAQYGFPTEFDLDSVQNILNAEITAGNSNETVMVKFSIENDSYEHLSTVYGKQMSFGTINYHYVVDGNDVIVSLTLDGTLSEDGGSIDLAGPYTGSGIIMMPGLPIAVTMQVVGTVTGTIYKRATK